MGFCYELPKVPTDTSQPTKEDHKIKTRNKNLGCQCQKLFFSPSCASYSPGLPWTPLVPCPTRAVSSDACTDTGYGSCLSSRGDEAKQSKSPSLNLQRKATHPLIHSSTTRVHDLERRDNTAVIHAAFQVKSKKNYIIYPLFIFIFVQPC
jgi:hypothetical protein